MMMMNFGAQQRQTHCKLLFGMKARHANVNHDHIVNHRHVLRVNLAVVRTIRPSLPVHLMKVVTYRKHVKKPNTAVAKMVFQLQQVKNTKAAQFHYVKAACLNVVHPMEKLKRKDRTVKVIYNRFELNLCFYMLEIIMSLLSY